MVDDRSSQEFGANGKHDTASEKEPSSSRQENRVSAWTIIGNICGDRLREQFRFNRDDRVWYEWREGTHWVEIRDTTIITDVLHNSRLRIAADLGEQGRDDLRDLLANDNAWRQATVSGKGEWWAAMRRSLARPMPCPGIHQIATPGGVVDVGTGELRPHDPLVHDTLALTTGNYLPKEIEELKGALWERLRHNLDSEDFEQLIEILGVAVARRCVDYCSVLWLIGASGAGKSAVAQLVAQAFGGMGLGASADMLARRSRSDIDADLAELLLVDPVVLCISEVERVGMARLLSLTGGDVLGARRPHGQMQRGTLSGLVILTSVVAPGMAVDAGIRRRLAVLEFPNRVPDSVMHDRDFTQAELDAVLTLSIDAALRVGTERWTPPRGNLKAMREFLADADPVAEWLQTLPDDWHGREFQELLAEYNCLTDERVTATLMGRRISASERWVSRRISSAGRKHLYLADRP